MKPLVSIIIPVFNDKETISLTLKNLLHQSYKNFEIIVVDDGSTDCTIKKVTEYTKKYSNIKLLTCEAEGFSKAQNIALEQAKGKYIIFFKSGNLLSYNYLEYMISLSQKYKANISSCDFMDINEHTFFRQDFKLPQTRKEIITQKTPQEYLRKLTTFKSHTFKSTYSLWNKLIEKNILIDFSFPENKFHFDKFSIIEIVKKSNYVIFSNQILIMNTLLDEYYHNTFFSYHELENIEFLEKLLITSKQNNNMNDLKNISLHLLQNLYTIRKKLINYYLELDDLESQKKSIDLKFNSIYKFLNAKFSKIASSSQYKTLFKKYKKLLHVEKFREKKYYIFCNPTRPFERACSDEYWFIHDSENEQT